ncbi:tRNA(Ile)-lysidine synthase [Symmachiella macrocystis]|uniref:tRNA(Ile)-lysidine synthase n=1 Tax=Symmachiella macrocystis TaxID=2527985 RepID=A0A5C6B7G5_9PLAN|nr:tRNA lysidine(34) synthetase TilS [Symmachiella macrocystis]TWU07229.1 tRNA(Ile)-lysidine synthase [Symmachiella macrocystis]
MSDPHQHPFLGSLSQAVKTVWDAGDALLAVSGGADSMALLRGMLDLNQAHSGRLAVAHFNHNLQPAVSDDVARWLQQTCERLDIPFHLGASDVGQLAAESGQGIEESARNARYAFFKQTALDNQFTQVLVAHTRDDQVETILHHLLRGTGVAGLRGMPERRALVPLSDGQPEIALLRPMLTVTRAQAVDYLRTVGQDYRDDPSNVDVAFTRNRIRHELLPLLETSFNPNIRDALSKLSQQAGDLQDALEQIVHQQLRGALLDVNADIVRLRWQPLNEQTRHVIRECFAMLWKQQHWPRQRMNFSHYDRLATLLQNGGTANLPGGIVAERRGELVVLRRQSHFT